ncbi:MAG: hypothetical protein ABIN91_15415 [Mucilaginibacter sp.]|uniref:hypothetical protein n=1 Tax=Mucilaginibacter sp. TaxID=1882438 RepID=UPI0032650684
MEFIPSLSKYTLGILLIASVITSCKKSDTPSSAQSTSGFGNISYFAKASAIATKTTTNAPTITTFAIKADSTVVVDWTAASLYIDKISFTGQGSSLIDTTITIEKRIDIFNLNVLAGSIKLPSGSYKNVTVKLYCKKSAKSELPFNLHGTFTNTKGGRDSVLVSSSFPFVANLSVNDIVLNSSDKYKVTFNFDLTKVLTGITNTLLQTAKSNTGTDGKKTYIIWKGGSAEEPFFDQVISNWQTVASVVVTKDSDL